MLYPYNWIVLSHLNNGVDLYLLTQEIYEKLSVKKAVQNNI